MPDWESVDVGGTIWVRITVGGEETRTTWRDFRDLRDRAAPGSTYRAPAWDAKRGRSLYRRLAKVLHPDADPAPLLGRPRADWMAIVNAAYEGRDMATLDTLASRFLRP